MNVSLCPPGSPTILLYGAPLQLVSRYEPFGGPVWVPTVSVMNTLFSLPFSQEQSFPDGVLHLIVQQVGYRKQVNFFH